MDHTAREERGADAGLIINQADLARTFELFCDGVIELRALRDLPSGTFSGYFDKLDPFLKAAAFCDKQPGVIGLYVTLNPPLPALLARSNNRLPRITKTATSDAEIERRRWFPIDVDCKRPAGISSTDNEHDMALDRVRAIREFLHDAGWPDGVIADSGNGGHLLFRIDLPNDDLSNALVKRALEALAEFFNDQHLKVDPVNHNAGRIWKAFGSIVRKGDSTPQRPHRLARILEMPAAVPVVDRELLEKLAALAPARQQPPRSKDTAISGANVPLADWLSARNIAVRGATPWAGGMRFILDHCIFDSSHVAGSAAFLEFPSGAKDYRCLHNSCAGRRWREARELMEPGCYDRRESVHGKAERESEARPAAFKALTLDELLAAQIQPREYVMEPVIQRQDIDMVFAKRGVGKTHFMLGLGYAIATGGRFMRWTAPKPRPVLIIDGEMDAASMKERMAAIAESSELRVPNPSFWRIITPDIQDIPIPNLTDPEAQATLELQLDGVEVVLIDSISTLCSAGEENKQESWTTMQEWSLQQRRKGRTIVFFHHASEAGKQRGSNKKEDVMNQIFKLEHPADYNPSQGARFIVSLTKNRGLKGPAAEPFEAWLQGLKGRETWTLRALDDAQYEQAVALYADGYSVREVEKEMGIPHARAQRYRKRAVKEGRFKE